MTDKMYFAADDMPDGIGAYVEKVNTKYGLRYKITGKYFPKKGQWYSVYAFEKVKGDWAKDGITQREAR